MHDRTSHLMIPPRLDENARLEALASLPGWSLVEGREAIERDFRFASFADAFAFMTRVAFIAEAMNHHPEWRNVYRDVEVTLSTHEAGGLTALDVELARAMDQVARQLIVAPS